MLWIVYVIIAIVLMSFSSFIVKLIIKEISPALVFFYQYLIAVPLVLTYSYLTGSLVAQGSPLILLLGIIYVLAIGFFYLGLKKGPLSRVSPVFNMKMIVTAVLGLAVLLEPLTIQLLIGLLFGGLGVYLLSGESK